METESLLCAAQGQVIKANSVKYSIGKISKTLLCRLCKENVESVTNITSACLMASGMNMFLIQCWRMKDAKSCGMFLSKLTRLLNIDSLILYA